MGWYTIRQAVNYELSTGAHSLCGEQRPRNRDKIPTYKDDSVELPISKAMKKALNLFLLGSNRVLVAERVGEAVARSRQLLITRLF